MQIISLGRKSADSRIQNVRRLNSYCNTKALIMASVIVQNANLNPKFVYTHYNWRSKSFLQQKGRPINSPFNFPASRFRFLNAFFPPRSICYNFYKGMFMFSYQLSPNFGLRSFLHCPFSGQTYQHGESGSGQP